MPSEPTPLQLYEKAYRLHHEENDVTAACEIYRTLIAEFPGSKEATYATVQLQRVHVSDISSALERAKRRRNALVGLGILINVLVVIAASAGGALYLGKLDQRTSRSDMLTRSMGLIYSGRSAEAIKLLDEYKVTFPGDFTPYALSSALYMRTGDSVRSRAEYDTYQRMVRPAAAAARQQVPPSPQPAPGTAWSSPAGTAPTTPQAQAVSPERPAGDSGSAQPSQRKPRPDDEGGRPLKKDELIKFLDQIESQR